MWWPAVKGGRRWRTLTPRDRRTDARRRMRRRWRGVGCAVARGRWRWGTRGQASGEAATPSVGAAPEPVRGQVVILAEANLRSGPSLGSAVVGGAHVGDRYVVTGRSGDQAWWRVCCVDGQRPAWLYSALAQWEPPPGLPQGGGTVTPTPTPPPALPFAIVEQEQHSEANYATIYVWVQDGHGVSLAGYRLLVTKDGAPVTAGAVRFGETQPNRSTPYRQGTTRPTAPGGPEDKPYNLKLAFDPQVVGAGFDPVGAWVVQLLDPLGQVAAPAALFALRAGDDHMEMYLHYGQRK